jgi:hypothetical protein
MQGKKKFTEKLFTHFQSSDLVPSENFYRRLKEAGKQMHAYVGYCLQPEKNIELEAKKNRSCSNDDEKAKRKPLFFLF